MTNAAIYLHADAIDTSGPRLMGRHSAGESFLRGYLRHAETDKVYYYNATDAPLAGLKALVDRIEPSSHEVQWISARNRRAISLAGCLSYPTPDLPAEAWARAPFGASLYSICGITHTTASQAAMDIISKMATAPVQSWDGLITPSRAVRSAVEYQLGAMEAHLGARLGATRFVRPQLATIPLGVNADDFAPDPAQRQAWRERLGIPDDGVAVLYVGRLHVAAKMNPAMMAMALEETAQRTGKPIYWIVSGWGVTDEVTTSYHEETRRLCPSVHYRAVDGRPADTRFSIWSAADIFLSFSDNIQETFGLTPVEAMAAGLPAVVTDWDGYRDTIAHGVDGFRIPTIAPRAGLGRDLAYHHANGWMGYELYLVSASLMTSMDHRAAVEALTALVMDPDLRRRMGEAGRRRAYAEFDWSVIIPQYQAFWGELAARRQAAQAEGLGGAVTDNPLRPDPFSLFESYPTEILGPDTILESVEGLTWEEALERLNGRLASVANWPKPNLAEMRQAFDLLQEAGSAAVQAILDRSPQNRWSFIERGLLWLAKFEVIRVRMAGTRDP